MFMPQLFIYTKDNRINSAHVSKTMHIILSPNCKILAHNDFAAAECQLDVQFGILAGCLRQSGQS